MANPKANYCSYTGILSRYEKAIINRNIKKTFTVELYRSLVNILQIKTQDKKRFKKDIILCLITYYKEERLKPPTLGQTKQAILEINNATTDLKNKLERVDITAKSIIIDKYNHEKSLESGDVFYNDSNEINKIINDLYLLQLATKEAMGINFPKKNGPDKSAIRNFIHDISVLACKYASFEPKITFSKNENLLRGALYEYLKTMLDAATNGPYQKYISNDIIFEVARRAIGGKSNPKNTPHTPLS